MHSNSAQLLLICCTLSFLLIIHLLAPRLRKVFPPLPIWRGVLWYRWKSLPSSQARAFSPFTGIMFPHKLMVCAKSAWICFTLHLIFMTSMVVWSQFKHSSSESHNCPQPSSPHWCGWDTHLDITNYIAILGNVLFVILRILQTHIWYDGLAHDVSEAYSMAAVFLALTAALLMQETERGIFFGFSFQSETMVLLTNIVRRNHGYLFAWAVVFTFWYHPAEAGIEHLSGFFIILLFLIQASLMFTTSHLNILWRNILELLMLFHSLIAEIHRTHRDIWKMFLSGCLAVFIITQMHAFPISLLFKSALIIVYFSILYFLYRNSSKGRWKEIFRFPLSYYLFAIIFYVTLYVAYVLISVLAYWPESPVEGTLPGGLHAPLVICAFVLVITSLILVILIGEFFEHLLRSLSAKAGPASEKVISLLEDPEKKVDIKRTKLPMVTLEEVQRHNQVSDCWVVIHGIVYDVTDFVSFHPGGKAILLKHCGRDGSKAFDGINGDRGHPKLVRERMRLFACGIFQKD